MLSHTGENSFSISYAHDFADVYPLLVVIQPYRIKWFDWWPLRVFQRLQLPERNREYAAYSMITAIDELRSEGQMNTALGNVLNSIRMTRVPH